MFCCYCGTSLPENAHFCAKCGKPQTNEVVESGSAPETCQIMLVEANQGGVFRAEAIGPQGPFNAGNTERFKLRSDEDLTRQHAGAVSAINGLITKLVADGWESTGGIGEDWWNHRFQRRFRPEARPQGPITQVSDLDFERVFAQSPQPILIFFEASQFQTMCSKMRPAFEQLAQADQGRATFACVDIAVNPLIGKRYDVVGVPVVVVVKNGRVVKSVMGVHRDAEQKYRQALEAAL